MVKDYPDERPPWWKNTLMRYNPMKDHPDERPPWANAHVNERQRKKKRKRKKESKKNEKEQSKIKEDSFLCAQKLRLGRTEASQKVCSKSHARKQWLYAQRHESELTDPETGSDLYTMWLSRRALNTDLATWVLVSKSKLFMDSFTSMLPIYCKKENAVQHCVDCRYVYIWYNECFIGRLMYEWINKLVI